MKIYYIFKVTIEKIIKQLIRYRFDTISQLAGLYLLFMVMFYGMKLFGTTWNVSPLRLGNSLQSFIIGYFLWTIIMMAYSDIAYGITNDASRGTLEQLNMTNIGLKTIIIIRSICNIIIRLLFSLIILYIIMDTTNYWLDLNLGQVLIVVLLGIFSILGLGLILGGLALIFKRIASLLNIVQYILIALVIPELYSDYIFAPILPFVPAINKVYDIVLGGESIWNSPIQDYLVIILNSVVYFIIGLVIFDKCAKVAKQKGLLGQY
ncbi:MAG: hypothetical protein N4A63_00440 [Vallitalea sp.]|jgi:ABC-2 type transport system permease protein|nr:hypothetical protein [Vallitalea sp.]